MSRVCVCGHFHTASCPWCGCSYPETEDDARMGFWGQSDSTDDEGRAL